MADATTTGASSSSNSAAQLYLGSMAGKLKLTKRVIKGKDGRPGEEQIYVSNTEFKPNQNLVFAVGDADVGRFARVIRAPSTYKDQANSAYTISVALEGEDAEGAKMLWNVIIDGMKEHGILDKKLVTTPDIMKMISHPIINESEDGGVFMTITLGDDVEYLRKITKGKMAGKFTRITRDQVHKGDGVVVIIKLDRHRDTPKHRFNRYAQRVFVIEQAKGASGAGAVIGSSGKQVDIVEYDSSMEDEDDGAPAAAAAPAAPAAPEDGDDDAFEQAMKRARKAVA
jgi:hypothetical protein